MTGLSPKQREAIQRTNHRINIWDGAIRSGKTLSSIIAWLDYCRYGPPGPLAMIGKTGQTLSRNVLDVIDELHPAAIKYTRGAPTAIIMGRLVHLFGAHNAQAEGRIRGLTLAGAYLDEATLVSKEFFTQLLGRLSVPGARLFATTNPDSNRHWLMQDYIKRAGEPGINLKRWHFELSDNPSLSREYLEAISAEFTGLFYKRFIKGLWVGADGAVYDEWDEERMTIPLADLPPIQRVLMVGIDYGQTHETRAYRMGLGEYEGRMRLFIIDEWAPESMTVGAHAKSLLDWIEHPPVEGMPAPEWLAVDPAAKVMRTELLSLGHTTLPAKNDVLPGIQTVASLLGAGSLLIVADTNPHLIDRIPQYLWDEKATLRGKTRPVKDGDDEVDALRYTVMSSRREWNDIVPLHAPNLDPADADDVAEAA